MTHGTCSAVGFLLPTALNNFMPTFSETMVTALETFLATNVGVGQVNIDGQMVKYERSQALIEYKYFKSIVAKESGAKKPVQQINLNTMW